MDEDTFQSLIIRALIWGLAYYFIRRGLNPENEDIKKFKKDAMYGSLAVFVSSIAYWYAKAYIVPRI